MAYDKLNQKGSNMSKEFAQHTLAAELRQGRIAKDVQNHNLIGSLQDAELVHNIAMADDCQIIVLERDFVDKSILSKNGLVDKVLAGEIECRPPFKNCILEIRGCESKYAIAIVAYEGIHNMANHESFPAFVSSKTKWTFIS